jgi:hypothetical protein
MSTVCSARVVIILLLLVIPLLCACYLKRTDGGPSAVGYWSWKYRALHKIPPSDQQKAEYRQQLRAEIEKYADAHPELTDIHKYHLLALIAWRGMTKAEVLLLLKDSGRVVRDRNELARLAGKFWPELQSRADEAWSYHDYDESILFFEGDTLIDILTTFTDVP